MEKNFPDNRDYPFWSITILALFAVSFESSVEMNKFLMLYSNLRHAL